MEKRYGAIMTTTVAKAAYKRLRKQMATQPAATWARWRQTCAERSRSAGGRAAAGTAKCKYNYTRIEAARSATAHFGGWEYKVKWESGERTWVTHEAMESGATHVVRQDMQNARETKRVPSSMWERMQMMKSRGATAQEREEANQLVEACRQNTLTTAMTKRLFKMYLQQVRLNDGGRDEIVRHNLSTAT